MATAMGSQVRKVAAGLICLCGGFSSGGMLYVACCFLRNRAVDVDVATRVGLTAAAVTSALILLGWVRGWDHWTLPDDYRTAARQSLGAAILCVVLATTLFATKFTAWWILSLIVIPGSTLAIFAWHCMRLRGFGGNNDDDHCD